MQTTNESATIMFRKLMGYYRISLMREIARPIEVSRLKSAMLTVLDALPELVPLAIGKSITKKAIVFQEFEGGSGLMTVFGDPVFVQFKMLDEAEYLLFSIISAPIFNQVIAALPASEHKILLQCLNLHPFYDKLAENEKIELQNACEIKLQSQKNLLPECENYDLELLGQNVGIAYLHNHYHIESWEFLLSRISRLKDNGIKLFYLELPKNTLDPLFKHFNETGDSNILQYHFDLYVNYIPEQVPYIIKLCALAHANGITVLPIDSSCELVHDDELNNQVISKKIHYRDTYMQLQIAKHQAERQENKKFAVLLGIRHRNIAINLNIPCVGLIPSSETKKTLAPDEDLQSIVELTQRWQNYSDVSLILSPRPTPVKTNSCCTSKLIRIGFFATVGSVAALAAAIAMQTFTP